VIELHRRSLEAVTAIVAAVSDSQLGRPTPCAQWNLGQLLAHMAVQNRGFAAAARGEQTELSYWEPGPYVPGSFADSADEVRQAFASSTTSLFWLPELPRTPYPAQTAIGFHLIDNIVHGWDVAKSLGYTPTFDADLLEAALPLTLAVAGGSARERPGASFGKELPGGDSALEQIVAWLGRDPHWQVY
jgi:uncharacterized protein (TIGR03086 family)